jgi:asparagine synthase (glutamine-hydrolysing)
VRRLYSGLRLWLQSSRWCLEMCGITGMFSFGVDAERVDPERLQVMRETLVHRGPDGSGMYVTEDGRVGLAHRRLAIVDIAGGAQPMFSERGTVIVFNGEIYNYPALRAQLELDGVRFRTRCDTEVILHLYDRYGRGCVEHLNGMFAFAIWDPAARHLFLARDRLGEKPLYWSQRDGVLYFGSEIKALLAHQRVPCELNAEVLETYFTHLVVPAPDTLFKGIHKLSPGMCATCTADGLSQHRYWDVRAPRQWRDGGALGDVAVELRERLETSITDRLMSDVPVGVLLSGGLDSTTLVALLHEQARGLATFSVGFKNNPALDEREVAARVARHYGTDHYEIAIDEQDAIAFLGELVHHQDEPLADPVCLPLNFVCQLARRSGVKVVLAGEGADELFWGYPSYRQTLRRWPALQIGLKLPAPIRRILPRLVRVDHHPYFHETLAGVASGRPLPAHAPLGLSRPHRRQIGVAGPDGLMLPGWQPSSADGDSALERFFFDTQEYEFEVRLPELLLMRIDRFSMAHSVEARVPFLDPGLVEWAYRLGLPYKLAQGETKLALRQAISDTVPDWVIQRPKKGFGAPVQSWLGGRLGNLFDSLLDSEAMGTYFDVDALRAMHAASRNGDASFSLWPVVNFALWHQHWIEGISLDGVIEEALTSK